MFVAPFLKFFKPFTGRLVIAVICMVIVGALSTAPLLIAREALNVFIYGGKVKSEELGEVSGLARGLIDVPKENEAPSQASSPTPNASGAPVAPAPAVETVKPKPHKSKSVLSIKAAQWRQAADQKLTGWLGRAYTTPRTWFNQGHDQFKVWQTAFKDWYHEKNRTSPLEVLAFLSIGLVIATILKGLAEYFSKYQLAYTFFLTNLQIRESIFGNVLNQDYLYFNANSPGYLHSRINSDVKAVRTILEGLLSDGIQQPINILAMFILLIVIQPSLTFGVMLILPIVGGLLYHFARVLRKNTSKQKRKEDQLSSSLTESLSNIRLVKAFGTEALEMGKFHIRTMALFKYVMARRMAKFGAAPIMESLGSIAVSGIIMIGGWMIITHRMTFVDFVIFLFTLSRFYRPLKQLAMLNNKYQEARVSAERMTEMLNLKSELHDNPQGQPFERLEQAIEIENVGFRYKDKQILEGLSLRVQAGEKVALAGPSGGGKTTLVNMIARLFDPSEGRILIDGTDLREIRLKDWRAHLAIVTQDTFLFDETIEYNIAYGCEGPIDSARVEAAARAANAHDFIMALDGGRGYKTIIGPAGNRLSGGQRQRLAIARAIYRDPKILILDEATSALDAQSQAIVQDALNHLMAGRTTFVIAHRTSTIRDVDRIYVIDQGRILETGSHAELMENGGLYAAMVTKVGLLPVSEDVLPSSPANGAGAGWPEEAEEPEEAEL